MSPEMLGLTMLGLLIFVIFLGFPIAFTLIFLSIVFGYIGFGDLVFDLMALQAFGTMQEQVLSAVPTFILMGYLLEHSGLMNRLFKGFQLILGPLKGSLYLAVLLTATVFAAATGIIGASVTLIGLLAAPTMLRERYDVKMTAGAITAGGTLGILIPPSIMLVLMGPVLGVSVVKLYGAAIMPGLLLASLYVAYCLIRCQINPKLGPALPLEDRAPNAAFAIKEFVVGVIPITVLIAATLGSILLGLATPTEAAALGSLGSAVMALAYRRLTFKMIKDSLFQTIETTSMVLFLAVAANVFAAVFSRLGTGMLITETMLGLPVPPQGMILVIMVLLFILGWPLEWPAIVLIFLPIVLPVVEALKVDMVWFGILVAVNMQTAFLSPPVAMAAYFLKSVAPEMELSQIYNGMFQFMILQVIGLAIVFLFPDFVTFLPNLMAAK